MSFEGDANRARYFNHVVTLVAKRVIHQFDVPKGRADAALDEAEQALRDLAKGIDLEERQMQAKHEVDGDEVDVSNDKDDKDALNMLPDACAELDESTWPVKLVLVKVSSF